MAVKSQAHSAINSLNGKALKGRAFTVNKASPRPENRRFGGRRGGRQRF